MKTKFKPENLKKAIVKLINQLERYETYRGKVFSIKTKPSPLVVSNYTQVGHKAIKDLCEFSKKYGFVKINPESMEFLSIPLCDIVECNLVTIVEHQSMAKFIDFYKTLIKKNQFK